MPNRKYSRSQEIRDLFFGHKIHRAAKEGPHAKINGQIDRRIDGTEQDRAYDGGVFDNPRNRVNWGWLVDDMGVVCAEMNQKTRALFLLLSYGSLQRRMRTSF